MNRITLWLALLLLSAVGNAKAVTVAVTIKPLHSIAAAVMHGVDSPQLLLDGTVSPHIDRIRPSLLRTMRAADLFIWIGPGLESFLAPAVNELPDKVSVLTASEQTLAASIALRDSHHDHSVEHHDHEKAIVDPHLWLDPANAAAIAQAIATQLAQIDPGNATQYAANARDFAAQMTALVAFGDALLVSSKQAPFVLFHDFAQYLENRFALNNAGVVTYQPQVSASARHLKALQRSIEALNVSCVLTEPQFEDRAVRALHTGSNIRYAVIDPLASAYEPNASLYTVWFRDTLHHLHECLSHE
ncbi:MAG: zinc ABC transporter substrate-binding protein [Pseudomonadota bacterium]